MATHTQALAVMAKAPVPGEAKTRLAAVLGPEEAAALYRCFLLDTLALAQQVPHADVFLFAMSNAHAGLLQGELGEHRQGSLHVLAQRGQGLLTGLSEAFQQLSAAGYERIALLNADSPTLPVEYLTAAFAALEQADLVMGPCDDGGYYLIAARQPYEWLFDGVAYDSSHICEQTIARARHGGLRVATVPRWYDVDTPAELERLCQELCSTSISGAIHTRGYLAQQRARGSVADGMIPATFEDAPEATLPHG